MSNSASIAEASRLWAKIGILSFGGPAAQIALMHREVVDERNWLTEKQFLNALSFCMLLPGPEAMQLATYMGWRLHGVMGGLIAGLLFIIPGAIIIAALAGAYSVWGAMPLAAAVFLGIKATVVVIVIEALLRLSKRALKRIDHWILAAIAFAAIFFLNVPFPLIVLAAGIWGALNRDKVTEDADVHALHPIKSTGKTILTWLIIWWVPILVLGPLLGQEFLYEIAMFFSKLAVVTFGGAYAVLAYMGQEVVSVKEWLSAGQMMDGLGLAETTPGPLILVTEFVGFLAGYAQGGWGMAIATATLTLWVTFTPCFLWIFVGAPYIDWIGTQPRLRSALSAITASVVGVILNLSVWFALHVFFNNVSPLEKGVLTLWVPEMASLNPIVVILTILAAYLLLRRHWNVVWVLALSGALALIAHLL